MDNRGHKHRQDKQAGIYAFLFTLFMLTTLILTTIACSQPGVMLERSRLLQPESPLAPEEFSPLTKNPWRVVTIIHQNETVAFDAIQPIYVQMGPEGLSAETGCNYLGFGLRIEGKQQYQLGEGNTTLVGCPEVQEKQYSSFYTALSMTTRFERQDDQLRLIGDETQIILEATHPFSLESPVFTQNRWQLMEIVHQGQPVLFDAMRPIYLEITGDGYLHFKTTQCNIFTFHMVVRSDTYYRFDMAGITPENCPLTGYEPTSAMFTAVLATNTLGFNDAQLVLTGDETRVVLEVDSDQ